MGIEVEFTDEFETWWNQLDELAQESVGVIVQLLSEDGVGLRFPYSSAIATSKFGMRELRIQHKGAPIRVLYAFDPRRAAVLLLGGFKTGDDLWYETNVRKADELFERHLQAIRREEQDNG